MHFTKMHGTGNDFVLVDASTLSADWATLARLVCDRHFGVGADGVILALPSAQADLRMRIFNPDGSEAEMCGNGIRCLAAFALARGLVPAHRERLAVETGAGVREVELQRENGRLVAVSVAMGEPDLAPERVPVDIRRFRGERVIDYPLEVGGRVIPITAVSMGNPHAVALLDEDIRCYPLEQVGPLVEYHSFFPNRVNFEVARVRDRQHIDLRVWERGAGLTLACGTGACATVVAARLHELVDEEVEVQLPGGPLTIRWEGKQVQMRGPVAFVFEGTWHGTVPPALYSTPSA
ncbi:MAG: diaminopimelate epimerase [Chloroflexi bacterium]|nr:diaminopimelate epimerase [Chloroflexota bacterium]